MVYLPTFTIKINHSCRQIYQSHGSYGGCKKSHLNHSGWSFPGDFVQYPEVTTALHSFADHVDHLQAMKTRNLTYAMENPPFEDVFPIQDGDFPLLCLFTGGYFFFGNPHASEWCCWIRWATKKKKKQLTTFHYTGWLIRILIILMVYYKSQYN